MKAFERDGKMVKRCSRCTEIKDVAEFGKCCKEADGMHTRCRVCVNIASRERAAKIRKPPRKSYQAYEHEGHMVKECTKCHEIKSVDEFHSHRKKDRPKQDGLSSLCKICAIERSIGYQEGRVLTPEIVEARKITASAWRKRNEEYLRTQKSEYGQREEVKIRRRENRRARCEMDPEYKKGLSATRAMHRAKPENRQRRNAEEKAKRAANPAYKLLVYARNYIRHALVDGDKVAHTEQLLGCKIEYFKRHLEDRFVEGMSWNNWTNKTGGWSIDHILPCGLFDLSIPSHQYACFGHLNLRPLWHIENVKKQDYLDDGRRARDMTPEEKKTYLISKGYAYLFEPTDPSLLSNPVDRNPS